MKKYLSFLLIAFCLFSCKTQKEIEYVPVESVKTEYIDRYYRDSIMQYDSVFVKEKGDTVWFEKYKYLYKDKIIRDSIYLNDTIRVPYRVPEIKYVNELKWWQEALMYFGLASGLVLLAYILFRLKK